MSTQPAPTYAPAPPGRSATYIGTFQLAGRAVERIAQFFQIVLIASVYGVAHEADVYFAASIVPLIIGTVLGEAIAASLLPRLVQRKPDELTALVSAGFWSAVAVVVVLTALYVAALVPLIEWRFHGNYSSLAPWLAFAPIAIALGVSAYLGAVLLQYERYVWPAFRQAVAAVAGLALTAAVLVATDGLVWVAAAVSAGYAVSLFLLALEVSHVAGVGWLAPPRLRYLREAASVWRNLTTGVTSGLLGGQVFVLLERAFAATFGTGGIATISYGRGIAFTPNVVAQSIAAGIYPEMVRAYAAEDRERLVRRFFHGLRLTLFVSVGFAALFAIYGPNLVGFLLQRGRFGGTTTEDVGAVLAAFAPALAGSMLMIFASRVFYSTDYFRAAVWMQSAALAVYVCIALPLRAVWGAPGLALAFGIAELVGGSLAVVLAARRLELGGWQVFRRGLLPGLRLGLRVAFALAVYRLVVESTWIEVPQRWKGVVMVGGALAVAAFTAGKALWQSEWPESRRLKDAAWKLILLPFRR